MPACVPLGWAGLLSEHGQGAQGVLFFESLLLAAQDPVAALAVGKG